MKLKHSCSFAGEETAADIYIDDPTKEAKTIVEKIMKANILPQNFIIKSATCKNALATTDGNNRYILYSTSFLENFKKEANTKWAAYCVLAHEIGHHLSNHDLTEKNLQKRKIYELQADKFAGGVLFRLGATLEQAQAGVNTFSLENESSTHPSKRQRLESLAKGWVDAKEMNGENTETSNNPSNTQSISNPVVKESLKPNDIIIPAGNIKCGECSGKGIKRVQETCSTCGGSGSAGKRTTCKSCNGSGSTPVSCSHCNGTGKTTFAGETSQCFFCKGTGKGSSISCKSCGGDGFFRNEFDKTSI